MGVAGAFGCGRARRGGRVYRPARATPRLSPRRSSLTGALHTSMGEGCAKPATRQKAMVADLPPRSLVARPGAGRAADHSRDAWCSMKLPCRPRADTLGGARGCLNLIRVWAASCSLRRAQRWACSSLTTGRPNRRLCLLLCCCLAPEALGRGPGAAPGCAGLPKSLAAKALPWRCKQACPALHRARTLKPSGIAATPASALPDWQQQ